MTDDRRSEADENLATYLNEHLLASEGGVQAFKAAAHTFEGTKHEAALLALSDEIERDRRDLAKIIQKLGFRPKGWKRLLTVVLRVGGRANPVNLLRRRGGSLAQFELDFLTGAVRAKRSMWDALLELAEDDPRQDRTLLVSLQLRADQQIAEVQRINRETVRERFLPRDA
ncbi:MAG: hypothetical protein ACQEWM_03905 [Actinomycetota bacterium]